MDTIAEALLAAQGKAAALFADVISNNLIRPGRLESEVSQDIYRMAKERFGVSRHWHKRIVRSGSNTLSTYHDDCEDRRVLEDDIVFLDFGPVFDAWEADYGRTYVVGHDPVKHRLVADIESAFQCGKRLYEQSPNMTAGELYDEVVHLAKLAGWEFGAPTAGHLIGHFPHEHASGNDRRFSIRHGNDLPLREPDAKGNQRHWILEIHFVDRARQMGGFCEELLTV